MFVRLFSVFGFHYLFLLLNVHQIQFGAQNVIDGGARRGVLPSAQAVSDQLFADLRLPDDAQPEAIVPDCCHQRRLLTSFLGILWPHGASGSESLQDFGDTAVRDA